MADEAKSTAPRWSDWYNTKAFPQRDLETYDGQVIDRETADAQHLNALEAQVALLAEYKAGYEKWKRYEKECEQIHAAAEALKTVGAIPDAGSLSKVPHP